MFRTRPIGVSTFSTRLSSARHSSPCVHRKDSANATSDTALSWHSSTSSCAISSSTRASALTTGSTPYSTRLRQNHTSASHSGSTLFRNRSAITSGITTACCRNGPTDRL